MKKAVITGVRKAEIVECPTPKAVGNWALIKIHSTPMCTEYKSFLAGHESRYLGHEAAGEVVEVAQPGRVKVGDRVAVMPQYGCGVCEYCVSGYYIHCRNSIDPRKYTGQTEGWATYAQYMLKPDWMLPAIPEGLSYDRAALAGCALGPSFAAMDAANVSAFDTVLITGLGPVGLGAVVNAAYRGAKTIVVESAPWRVELAKKMGVTMVADPGSPDCVKEIRAFTGDRGVDCAVDCSGAPQAQRVCIESLRRLGAMCFVGESTEKVSIHASADMIRNGIRLFGIWFYNMNLFPKLMEVVTNSPLIDLLVSHRLPMSDIQKAMELSASPEHGKIILHPWE